MQLLLHLSNPALNIRLLRINVYQPPLSKECKQAIQCTGDRRARGVGKGGIILARQERSKKLADRLEVGI